MKNKAPVYFTLWSVAIALICSFVFSNFYRLKYKGEILTIRENVVPVYFHDAQTNCYESGLDPLEFKQIVQSINANVWKCDEEVKYTEITDRCGLMVFKTVWQSKSPTIQWGGSNSFMTELVYRLSPSIYSVEENPCSWGGFSTTDLFTILDYINQLPNRSGQYVVEVEGGYNSINVNMGKCCSEPTGDSGGGHGTRYQFVKQKGKWELSISTNWHMESFGPEWTEKLRETYLKIRDE